MDFPQNLFFHLTSECIIQTPGSFSEQTAHKATELICTSNILTNDRYFTLPEDKVFRLSMACRYWGVMADLKKTQTIDWHKHDVIMYINKPSITLAWTYSYLLSYKAISFIWPVTLIRLSQHWVERFPSCSVVTGGIAWYRKRCNVHLHMHTTLAVTLILVHPGLYKTGEKYIRYHRPPLLN